MRELPTLCIYHGNCADGFSAAWVVHQFYGPGEVEFFAGVHGEAPPDVVDRDVILVDFSYPRPVIDRMLAVCRSMLILDHHESAEKDLEGVFEHPKVQGAFMMQHSGAMMAWNWFFNNFPRDSRDQRPWVEPPELLKHVEARDLWDFDRLENTREINAAMFSYPYSFECWDWLMLERPIEDMVSDGAAIERKHHKDIRELIDVMATRTIIGGYDVPIVNLPYTMASDACNVLCREEPFAASYYMDKHGQRVFSLRSDDAGLNVADIAVQYGGGGHAHAAGFRLAEGVSL